MKVIWIWDMRKTAVNPKGLVRTIEEIVVPLIEEENRVHGTNLQ